MSANIVMFDMDDTLSSESTLGQKSRKCFFPKTTKTVFDELVKRGDTVIICSKYSSRQEVESALSDAQINVDNVVILGNAKNNKVVIAQQYKTDRNAAGIVIVDDAVGIEDTSDDVVHIQVPYYVNHAAPPSDAYLKAALLPFNELLSIKSSVRAIKKNIHKQQIDSETLDKYYTALVNLNKYKEKRKKDPREFYTNWAAIFGGKARSRTAKLETVDHIIASLHNGTFSHVNLPAAAKNGELSTIVGLIPEMR